MVNASCKSPGGYREVVKMGIELVLLGGGEGVIFSNKNICYSSA